MEFLLGPDLIFRNAVLGGLLVALACSLLGVYVVLRRLVLLGVALPQAGAAGIAAVFWLTGHTDQPGSGHASALIGSLIATFGALALLVLARRGGRFPAEWGVGAIFAIASAATLLFVALNPSGDLEMTNLLHGDLLAISNRDLAILAVTSSATLALFFLFQREILLASFDPEFARTIDHNPARADALLFALLGSVIAVGVMDAGPLVVFGFLVLPALAALRVAPGLGAALGIAGAIAAFCAIGGFAIGYHVDLPTGPTSVALAAVCWLVLTIGARLGQRLAPRRAGATVALLLCASLTGVAGLVGCATTSEDLARGSEPAATLLPDLSGRGAVSVARFANETGNELLLHNANPLRDLSRATGLERGQEVLTVPDALAELASVELARRNVTVSPMESAREAADAAIGLLLTGTLSRFTITKTGLLLVRLELALVDPRTDQVLWRGSARKPVRVPSALTLQQVVIDSAPQIFSECFDQP